MFRAATVRERMAREITARADLTETAREITVRADLTETVREITVRADLTEMVREITVRADLTETARETTVRADLTETAREITVRADLTKTAREMAVRADFPDAPVRVPAEDSPASHPLMRQYRLSHPATVKIKTHIKMTDLIRETEWRTEKQNPA